MFVQLKKYGAKQGAWAGKFLAVLNQVFIAQMTRTTVVTGATDGIGREFASQLAKAGFNVLIASRSQDKLDAFASELREPDLLFLSRVMQTLNHVAESKYSITSKTYAIDFSRRDVQSYAGFAAALEGLDIGVLGAPLVMIQTRTN